MLLQDFTEWTSWQDFINWWDSLGATEQIILGIIGIIIAVAVTVLVCIGIFYLLKYLFIGLGYLFTAIFKGLAWMFKKLGELVAYIFGWEKVETGEGEQSQQVNTTESQTQQKSIVEIPKRIKTVPEHQDITENYFCTSCGMKFTNKMAEKMDVNGMAFCVYCGTGFKTEMIQQKLQSVPQVGGKDYSNYQ